MQKNRKLSSSPSKTAVFAFCQNCFVFNFIWDLEDYCFSQCCELILQYRLLLCAEKSEEIIELLELDKSGIHVATYLTELPPVEWLRSKLLKAIDDARNRLQNKTED